MRAVVLFGLLSALAVCNGQPENCDVFPKNAMIRMGSDIEVMFKGPNHGLCSNVPSYNPSKITWMLNDTKIDKSFYRVINSTIPAVLIQNFTLQEGRIMCRMDVDGNNIVLGGTIIKAFFPPKKPTNISCITIFEESFTCYWDNGHEPNTSYTVFRERDSYRDTCTSQSSPCVFNQEIMRTLNISVRAENAFGVTISDFVEIDPIKTTKLQSPEHVHVTPHLNWLLVKWKRPENMANLNVVCEVLYQYHRDGSQIQHVKSIEMGEIANEGVADIKVEQLCTRYHVSVRCKFRYSLWGYWSQSTPVDSSLDVNNIAFYLWRKIYTLDDKGKRRVLLMWKTVPSSCTAIDGYRITVINLRSSNCTVDNCTVFLTRSSNQLNLTVHHEEYKITIAAYQNISTFSEDSVFVPAVGEECPSVKEVNTVASDNHIMVKWTASPSSQAVRYMIDWSAGNDDIRWHESNKTHFTIKGEPQKLYRIAVTPLYDSCAGKETIVLAYAKEGAPEAITLLEVSDVQESSARISWMPVPRNKCCGFVRNYTVFYMGDKSTTAGITVNSSVYEVSLHGLKPSTTYNISVVARSDGGQSVANILFRTIGNGRSFSKILGVLGALGLILFIVIGISGFIMVNKYITKVPSPQFSSLVLWPDQLYEKDKNVTKLLIPECSEHISHSLVMFPLGLDLDIEISPTSVENGHAEIPGSLAKQPKFFADDDDSKTHTNSLIETKITAPPSAHLLSVHEGPTATADSKNTGDMALGQSLGDTDLTSPCFITSVGWKECLNEGKVAEKANERQNFLESQRNVPQAYVTMDLFDQSQTMGM